MNVPTAHEHTLIVLANLLRRMVTLSSQLRNETDRMSTAHGQAELLRTNPVAREFHLLLQAIDLIKGFMRHLGWQITDLGDAPMEIGTLAQLISPEGDIVELYESNLTPKTTDMLQ